MNIPADSVLFHAHDQRDLAVGFESYQTVNHVAARFFKHLGPVDIVLLVKARLEFHEDGNLLSVVCRLGQSRDNGRIAADPVQGLLNCQNLRIPGRAAHKVHDRVKALVRMMKENIALSDICKNVVLIHQRRYGLRLMRHGFEIFKSGQTIHLHEKGQIQRTVYIKNILAADGQLLLQNL